MSSTSVPTPGTIAPLSEPQRIINTFIAPSKTFADVKRVGRWWAPWLLISIFSYALVGVVAQKIGFDQVTENQLKLSPKRAEQLEKSPPEDRARRMQFSVTITKTISLLIPLVNVIYFAFIAAVLLATMKFGAGAEITFATALAVTTYSYLPSIVHVLLAIASVFAGADPEGFNFQNPVASNLGHLVSPASSPAVYALLSKIDIFSIWICVLLAIGFASVSKLKRSTTMAIVFGWYVLVTLLSVGFAAAFS
ncbi:MAG: YIP1 family protein [Acidobacteria bacterium]|nr:YIP1 family protein [Acidobacteriota bacterium]